MDALALLQQDSACKSHTTCPLTSTLNLENTNQSFNDLIFAHISINEQNNSMEIS